MIDIFVAHTSFIHVFLIPRYQYHYVLVSLLPLLITIITITIIQVGKIIAQIRLQFEKARATRKALSDNVLSRLGRLNERISVVEGLLCELLVN